MNELRKILIRKNNELEKELNNMNVLDPKFKSTVEVTLLIATMLERTKQFEKGEK